MDGQGWSRWHHRVHRQLLDQPTLLPPHSRLLLAVSGGQDSMALLRLLLDLRHLHHWSLQVWHGDHRWHANSSQIASALEAWCQQHDLTLMVSRADPDEASSESSARDWRYRELLHHCRQLGSDAVTAHTASDRAETMLINLARGGDLPGLCSLPSRRALSAEEPDGPCLRRPLLQFSRRETTAICAELNLPIWLDPSNASSIPARNRIRHSVLPVLEELHPGCTQRMSNLAERVSQVRDSQRDLSRMALEMLHTPDGLDRRRLGTLNQATRRMLLAHWLQQQGLQPLPAPQLEQLSRRLEHGAPSGSADLADGWRLSWKGSELILQRRSTAC